jgi:membrane-associated protease RseP (regulator of RpoE activity)
MGAVINVRGQIPNRRALFDIGVAGPLAGIGATIIVAVIGLLLPPITVPEWVLSNPNAFEVRFGYPPLLRLIAMGIDQPIAYADPTKAANPVFFGARVGLFVTFLNLLPVVTLDGGHLIRSMFAEHHHVIARFVPFLLFSLGGYLYFVEDIGGPAGIWIFWGLLALLFLRLGAVTPIQDTEPLDRTRFFIGILTLIIGALCFTPVPIQIIN